MARNDHNRLIRVGRLQAVMAVAATLATLGLPLVGCTSAAAPERVAEAPPVALPEATIAERWGVEMVAVRLTAADRMIDVRYRVLDPAKAAPLFVRANKPLLLDPASGAEIPVHSPTKTGPLRPTNPPQAGRVYFTMFSNPQGRVKRGDPVTLKIGEFEAAAIVE